MKKNWLTGEAKKADTSRDYVFLENPATRKYLDDLLLKRASCPLNIWENFSAQPILSMRHIESVRGL